MAFRQNVSSRYSTATDAEVILINSHWDALTAGCGKKEKTSTTNNIYGGKHHGNKEQGISNQVAKMKKNQ